MTHRFLAAALAIALPLSCAAAGAGTATGCTVVAGGGRQIASADPRANDHWNRLNFSFFDATLTAAGATVDVVPAFFAVEAGDAAKNTDMVLAQASKSGCTRLLSVSVYGDDSKADGELVFALRVSPIQKSGSASGALSVGTVEYEREYRFTATPASLNKAVPSRIAEQALNDYLGARRR